MNSSPEVREVFGAEDDACGTVNNTPVSSLTDSTFNVEGGSLGADNVIGGGLFLPALGCGGGGRGAGPSEKGISNTTSEVDAGRLFAVALIVEGGSFGALRVIGGGLFLPGLATGAIMGAGADSRGVSEVVAFCDAEEEVETADMLSIVTLIVDAGSFGDFSVIGGGRFLAGGAALVGCGSRCSCMVGAARDHSCGSSAGALCGTAGAGGKGLAGGNEGACVLVAGDTGGVLPTCSVL